MKKFNNPLDDVHVASPCPANWNSMYGSERVRHCSECKMNVYNLSDMSRTDAESLIINTEGRLCVRFFRRSDGSILTKNCPVGWRAVKQRVSRVATAAFSVVAGLVGGLAGVSLLTRGEVAFPQYEATAGAVSVPVSEESSRTPNQMEEEIGEGDWMEGQMELGTPAENTRPAVGRRLGRVR
ncbi:MAG: hypothetical protein WKF34_13980 [Pyrinomonadaceae bacterium]